MTSSDSTFESYSNSLRTRSIPTANSFCPSWERSIMDVPTSVVHRDCTSTVVWTKSSGLTLTCTGGVISGVRGGGGGGWISGRPVQQ